MWGKKPIETGNTMMQGYFRGTFTWRPVHPACIINLESSVYGLRLGSTHSSIVNKIIAKCLLFIKSNIILDTHSRTGSGRQLNFIEFASEAFAYMRNSLLFLSAPMISRRHKCSTWIKIDVKAIDTFFPYLKMLPDKQFFAYEIDSWWCVVSTAFRIKKCQ